MAKGITGISFNTTRERRRLAKALAARRDVDVSTLMNDLLQQEIDRVFTPEMQAQLLGESSTGAPKKRPKLGRSAADPIELAEAA